MTPALLISPAPPACPSDFAHLGESIEFGARTRDLYRARTFRAEWCAKLRPNSNHRSLKGLGGSNPPPSATQSSIVGFSLTLFLPLIVPAFNFAFVEDWAHYHTQLDNRVNLSEASLQMHGDSLLGVVTGLSSADFSRLRGPNAIYRTSACKPNARLGRSSPPSTAQFRSAIILVKAGVALWKLS